ncbi:MAG TPA: methyl-accepting chemotaxis protein [Steroidobacteraceae bacterium]|jgi:methyl-accepting chemotaxis protein-1 (serine sensor receptor)
MNFSSLSVRARLFLTLSLLGAALVIVGLLGLRSLKQSNAELNSVFRDNLMPIVWINQISANSRDNVLALDEALMTGKPEVIAKFKLEAEANNKVSAEVWSKYQATEMAPGEKELADGFTRARDDYRRVRNAIADQLAAGQLDAARKRREDELQGPIDVMIAAGQQLLELQQRVAAEAGTLAEANYTHATIVAWTSIVLGLGLGGVFGWLLVTSMLNALNTAVQVSERIAGGELGQEFAISSKDEFGRLLAALKDMDAKLSGIVGTVRVGADAVGTAARQISNGNDDLSQRTQEQASALEETASSMEEMTATVKQNADNARQASQLAVGARDQADRGGDIVGRAVNAMSAINESSSRIADIINVIDEIAFQTNLLALNAAVEAARAGEQGRGFAVVASEVRNLAQRSATAAKEIKGLIGDSVEKVKAGTQLVDESGKSLSEIVASVKKVADIVAEISAASEEQAAGIDQVNTAVTQMDSVTQQNAALVEEASAASKSMEHQAQALVEKIGFFRIGQSQLLAATAEMEAQAARPSASVQALPVRKAVGVKARSAPHSVPSARRPVKASGGDSVWQEF